MASLLHGKTTLAGFRNLIKTSWRLKSSSPTRTSEEGIISSIPYRGDYSQEASDERRRWAEDMTGESLATLDGWWGPNANFESKYLKGRVENAIGVARIPIGLIGPININGKYANGSFVVPAATLEGTLCASSSRGCSALNASGGVQVCAFRQRMLRSPTVACGDPDQAQKLKEWIGANFHRFHDVVLSASKRAKLKEVTSFIDGKHLNLTFDYETGEATGQNMVSICTHTVCLWIAQQIMDELPDVKLEWFIEENVLSGEKRNSSLNAIFGRGVSVIAEASIPERVLQSVLKVNSTAAYEMFDPYRERCLRSGSGSTQIGNVANVIAATYAALGQDLGSVGESSQSFLNVKVRTDAEGGIDVKLNMPCITVGTIGGGTGLPTQQQCLKLMGCTGPKSNFKLAEIIASVCLAGDLSLMAAIGSGQHASAHALLGR